MRFRRSQRAVGGSVDTDAQVGTWTLTARLPTAAGAASYAHARRHLSPNHPQQEIMTTQPQKTSPGGRTKTRISFSTALILACERRSGSAPLSADVYRHSWVLVDARAE